MSDDQIPADAITPIVHAKVDHGVRGPNGQRVVLRMTERDGTLHYFSLIPSDARTVAEQLLRQARLSDGRAETENESR